MLARGITMITAEVINNLNSQNLSFISGSLQAVASKVLPPEISTSDALVFVSKPEQLDRAIKSNAPIIVTHKSLNLPTDKPTAFFITDNIKLAMATILPLFDGKMNRFNQAEKIHPTASIHPSANLGENVYVGAFAVIGEGTRIGSYSTIGSQSTIEPFAIIGDHCIIHPQVFVGANCEIGSNCEFHPHTTIGADGFAFVTEKNGTQKKIPQIGKVIIGNNVEMGGNCVVDRAALTETRIGNGTKFDNICHVAHNVVIGENCLIAAGFLIAGSSKIGNNCMFGGRVSITDHVELCNNVILGGGSIVTNDIKTPGAYSGYPIEPLRENMKTLASFGNGNLLKMRKQLSKIIRHLGLNEE